MNEPDRAQSTSKNRDAIRGGRVGSIVLASAIVIGAILCILMAAPFLGALASALALAILFAPLHERIERRLKHRDLAATVSVLVLILIVAAPAGFVVERIVEEAAKSATLIQQRVAAGAVQQLLDSHPAIAPIGQWLERQVDLRAMIGNLATWLSNLGTSFVWGSVVQAIQVMLTFYLLYYFLRDRQSARHFLYKALPFTPAEIDKLYRRVVDTVHATIYGTIAVAAVQGSLGGLMFWILDLPTPLLWGLAMGLLSVVPVLGAFIIWIPAAILLALAGQWVQAAVLSVWGAVVVGGVDNILRPMLVGSRLQLHTVPAFISMLGGVVLFGASGFILGPLVVVTTMLLAEFWTARLTAAAEVEDGPV